MSEFSRSSAVVIGINAYGNGIPPLQTAANDAREVARILKQEHKYDKVWLLLDEQASLQALQQILDQVLVAQTQADERLLFYFAGHGIALNGEDGAEGFLIPQDAKLGDTKSYLPMPKLQSSLSQLPCRHFLGILDCCFAGAFRWSSTRKLVPVELGIIHKERFDRFIADPAWQVITSAAHDQTALDSLSLDTKRGKAGNHSPFAAALIEALSGQADVYPPAALGKPAGDGVTTATELYLYLRDRIEPATEGFHRQTPGIWPLKKHDKGEYIFLTPGHMLNLPPAPPLDESKNPYRGLQSFEAEQSDLFFGRQALTRKLGEFVRSQSLTVVLGASGSGKSSLVKAGLIPDLKQQDAKADQPQWKILAPMRPGEAPFKALSNALAQESTSAIEMLAQYMAVWSQQHPGMKLLLAIDQFEELITLCRDDKEREQFLIGLVQAVAAYPEQLRLVLTLRSDFEPQFQDAALKDYWSAARFVVPPMMRSELREAIEEPASKRVMYFQSDDPKNPLVDRLIDEVAEMPGALPLLSFTLSELYLKYLRRQKIAQDRGNSIDRAITEADYKELGGVARSLTQRADQEYEALVQQDPAYEQTIRHVMLRMVAVGGGELARRRVPLSEFEYPPTQNDRVKQVIQRFSAARLLVEGQDPDGRPYAEPAHDALVRGWQKLLTWKQEEAESLILQRRLTPAAEEWKDVAAKKQSKGLLAKAEPAIDGLDRGFYAIENLLNKTTARFVRLWQRSQPQQGRSREQSGQFLWNTNPYLDVLNEQLKSSNNGFNQVEAEFVQKSVLQRRQNTSWRWRIATGVILGLSGLTIAALIGQREAQIGQARAFQQTAEASLLSSKELDGLVGALHAGRTLETLLPFGLLKPEQDLLQVNGTLQKLIDQNTERNHLEIENVIKSSQGNFPKDLGFSETGQLVVTTISKDAIELWDLESQQRLHQFDAAQLGSQYQDSWERGLGLLNAKFSPNGNILAIKTDHIVQLWNAQSKQQIGSFSENEIKVDRMFFSPNSKFLAVVGQDTTGESEIGLWDLEFKKWAIVSKLPKSSIIAKVIWSANGKQVILSDFSEGSLYVWNLSANQLEKIEKNNFNSQDAMGKTILLSPDNKLWATVAIGNGQGSPSYELWQREENGAQPTLIKSFSGYSPLGFGGVIWSNDGKKTATIDSDGVVQLWDFNKAALVNFPRNNFSNSVENSGKQGRFSDAWDSNTRNSLTKIKDEIKHKYPEDQWKQGIESLIDNSNVTFSPDGKKLAIVDNWKQRFYYFWDLESQEEMQGLTKALVEQRSSKMGTQSEIDSLSFSPDNTLLAISISSNLFLWDLRKNQRLDISIQGDKSCNGVQNDLIFSPDSKIMAFRTTDYQGGNNHTSFVCLRNLSGIQIAKFKSTPNSYLTKLSFTPDSKMLYSLSDDNQKNIAEWWKIESLHELIVHGCSLVHDYLNDPGSDAGESDRHLCDGIGGSQSGSVPVATPASQDSESSQPQSQQPSDEATSVPPSTPMTPTP